MKRFAIYGLYDPRDNELRYIGLTEDVKRRLTQHRLAVNYAWKTTLAGSELREPYSMLDAWLYDLGSNKLSPEIKVIWYIKVDSRYEAEEFEKELIQSYCLNHGLVNGRHMPRELQYVVPA